mgnify:CR=1 FL=1
MILNHKSNNRIKRREAETKNKAKRKMELLRLKEDNPVDQLIRISRS